MLESSYWSVKQVSLESLDAVTEGVALATPSEARIRVTHPKSNCAQALLCTKDITGNGVCLEVPVKDKNDRYATRIRYLVQLGATDVLYNAKLIPKGGPVISVTTWVALSIQKAHVSPAI